MSTKIISEIIAICQVFASGMIFQKQIEWAKGTKEIIKAIAIALSVLIFGIIILAIYLILVLLGGLYHKVYNGLHIGFILSYMVF